MNIFGHEVMLAVFAEVDITHVSVFSSCGLSCSPFWSVVFYCGFGKPFSNSTSKFLFVISKVCYELPLVYMPVLLWVTFVI